MGKILPGVFLTFENTKGGVGKSTITALFAGYIHATAKNTGLTIGVVETTHKILSEKCVKLKKRNLKTLMKNMI